MNLAEGTAYVEQAIKRAAEGGWLEATQSHRLAETYSLPPESVAWIKSIKAKYRNELSFGTDK